MKYKISSLKLSKPLRFFIGLVLIFAIGAVSTSKLSAKPKTSVILVHGTLGDNHSWGSPKKGFHKAIEQNFNSPAEFEVIPFGWSGRLSSKTRLEAAGQLSELILKLSPTNKVVTIGHSHGGTIINLASQILEICSLADPAQIENQINSLILNLESISAKENELALKVINQPFITKKGLNSVAKFFSNKVIPKAEKLTKNK